MATYAQFNVDGRIVNVLGEEVRARFVMRTGKARKIVPLALTDNAKYDDGTQTLAYGATVKVSPVLMRTMKAGIGVRRGKTQKASDCVRLTVGATGKPHEVELSEAEEFVLADADYQLQIGIGANWFNVDTTRTGTKESRGKEERELTRYGLSVAVAATGYGIQTLAASGSVVESDVRTVAVAVPVSREPVETDSPVPATPPANGHTEEEVPAK